LGLPETAFEEDCRAKLEAGDLVKPRAERRVARLVAGQPASRISTISVDKQAEPSA